MTKLLHTADIHLDSPLTSLALRDPDLQAQIRAATRAALLGIVETCLGEKVAALLIAGDLFDGAVRSARSAAFVTEIFDRLRRAGIAVFLIRGNHDAINPITGAMTLPENVHVFGAGGGTRRIGDTDIHVHGVSFSGRQAPHSLLPKFPAPVPGAVNIALLHTSLSGAAGHDDYAPCSVADLRGMGFDYWALGHVHRRQVHGEDPWIVMPGMPQGRDIGEAGAKSATLLTVGPGGITIAEIPTAEVIFEHMEISAEGCAGEDALRDRCRSALRDRAETLDAPAAILRLRLGGAFDRSWQVTRDAESWRITLTEMARETGRLWIEAVDFDLRDPEDGAARAGPLAELVALMDVIRKEPGHAARLEAHLSEVLKTLPDDRRRELLKDPGAQAALLDRLAQEGARQITALMRGADG